MTENSYKTPCGCIHYFVNIIDKQKITLVFLPGLTADHRLFEKQIEYFEKKQNVFVWDAPSHALSRPFTNNYSLSDMAEWLDKILTKEEIYNPIIIGQSMGGYLAQMYMELYPDKIKGFISIDSAPLQKSYMTAMEIWLLERAELLYKIYPWKALLRAGSRGCAETSYGQKLMRKMMMSYDSDPKKNMQDLPVLVTECLLRQLKQICHIILVVRHYLSVEKRIKQVQPKSIIRNGIRGKVYHLNG